MSHSIPKSFSLIGAGRLASVLGLALSEVGLSCGVVVNRSLSQAESLARKIGSGSAQSLDSMKPLSGELIIISVADDAILSVRTRLEKSETVWSGKIVLHTSGVLSSSVLSPLQELGAETASFHPLQTFASEPRAGACADLFTGIPVAIEGAGNAVMLADQLAERLGARPFHISSDAKALYHAAAVTASNFMVTLSALADELYAASEPANEAPRGLFSALASQAIANAYALSPGEALTGPVVRGDVDVLALHLSEIEKRAGHLIPAYAAMATETVRLAVESDRLDSDTATAMLDLLSGFMRTYERTYTGP